MILDNQLFIVPKNVQTRWASPENPTAEKGNAAKTNGGRKGRANIPVPKGQSVVLAEEKNVSGTIRRIWVTMNVRTREMMRSLKIEFFWDGAEKPAISAPFGDFFGVGLGYNATFENAFFSSPEGRSYNCIIPMPFKKGMKIVLTNEGNVDVPNMFYDIDYTIGDEHPEDVCYLHAYFNRENKTTLKKDYEILPIINGTGRFLGVNIGMIANQEVYSNTWWGEGECKIYIDGDTDYPTFSGTGTEDYIGSAWCLGKFNNMYQGCLVAEDEKMEYCFYRYHVPDPVYFAKDIKVTMQQIGIWDPEVLKVFKEKGYKYYEAGPGLKELDLSDVDSIPGIGLFEREDDWSSCAYFYLNSPTNDLPPLIPVEERIKDISEE